METQKTKRSAHLVAMNTEMAGTPLFLIPGTGGTIPMYKLIGKALNNTCTLYGLEMRGTKRDEPPCKSIAEIATQNIQWIRQVQPEGPYRFLCHSFGAYVMFEMTKQLENAGDTVGFMAVLDQNLGFLSGIAPGTSVADYGLWLTRDYFESYKIIQPPYPDWVEELRNSLEKLSMENIVPHMAAFVREKLPHKARSIDYFSRLVNIRLHNGAMIYFPFGQINTEVILFKATKHDWSDLDETLGWSAHCRNIKCYHVPGNHMSLIWGKKVNNVVAYLKQHMGTCENMLK